MKHNHLSVRRPYPLLTKLTLVGLLATVLAYGSEFIILGHIDREIGVVVACLRGASVLVARGGRLAPAIGALVAGAILINNPFLLRHLSLPATSSCFIATATQMMGSLLVVAAGLGATAQNYRKQSR